VSDTAQHEFEDAVAALSTEATRTTRYGETPEHGYFVQPALVEADGWDREVFGAEVFGPLLTVFEVGGLEQGIERCNDTPYGLSASVFTRSVKQALAFADGIEAGMVHVNSQTTGAEPHVPFGGAKRSSNYSRELGRESVDFFSQLQSIYLEGTG
jgi:aldehyde dehydrogenase (NAD+)